MFQLYRLVLQKSENLKYHLHSACGGIPLVKQIHQYLDNECKIFIIFAFLVVFSSI